MKQTPITIGAEIYYIADTEVVTSPIVSASTQEFTEHSDRDHEVILELESGLRVVETEACYTLEDLLKQLSANFKHRQATNKATS